MKSYGKFSMTVEDGVMFFRRSASDGVADFYEMQSHDQEVKRAAAANGGPTPTKSDEPIFNDPWYWVVGTDGVIAGIEQDVGLLVPDGELWGGEMPPEHVLETPDQYRFDPDNANTWILIVPDNWKEQAQGRVRAVRDTLLQDIPDPNETDAGRLAWNAKLLSSLVVLTGLDKIKTLFGDTELPVEIENAVAQITQIMTSLADAEGLTLEQFAFKIVGKFFGFSAFVWLADEKTQKAWNVIAGLPDNAEGYSTLPALEEQLRTEVEATVAALKAAHD